MSSSSPTNASGDAPAGRPSGLRRGRQATNAGAFDESDLTGPNSSPQSARVGEDGQGLARRSPAKKDRGTDRLPVREPPPAGPSPPAPPAVAVHNLGKCYHIYNKPEDRLKQALLRFRGKNYFDEFWALRNVCFEVAPGEAVGIVGRNGSGKSTLMQIIAGTLAPTEGQVTVRGRVAALLELGSGFNPDFTGRENVHTYGAILGMSRRDIDERFDEIAAFADIGRFLDQPVKTYSSGMRVRLAFAVQVQVRPEVLIIDEALTVGDNLFQKRCHERLRLLREAGTTLLFVSHQQEIIRTLTSRCVLLHAGTMRAVGAPGDVLLEYRKLLHDEEKRWTTRRLEAAAKHTPAEQSRVREHATDPSPLGPGEPATDPAARTGPPTADPLAESHPPGTLELSLALASPGEREIDAPVDSTPPAHSARPRAFGDGDASITAVEMLAADAEPCSLFYPGDRVLIRIAVRFDRDLDHINVALRLRDKHGVKVHSWGTLNQDIATRSGLRPYDDPTGAGGEHEGQMPTPPSVWDRRFPAGSTATVEFEWLCTLGAGFYEVQACVSQEATPDYRNQRTLHWLDEAAFFEVKVAREEYFFGGLCDLRMRAEVLD